MRRLTVVAFCLALAWGSSLYSACSSSGSGGGDAGDAGADTGGENGTAGGAGDGGSSAGTSGGGRGGEAGDPSIGGAGNGNGGEGGGNGGAGDGNGGASGDGGVGEGGAGEGGGGPRCGNGVREAPEMCDEGSENGLELARCAPDCSRIIERKHITVGTEFPNGNLQPNPVAAADARCPTGYKALFAYGTTRRATTTPYRNANAIDWPLRPYTYYVSRTENPVWLTRDVALLGVENGAFVGLENPIDQATQVMISGLNPDGTTLSTNNCNGWSSPNNGFDKVYGLPLLTDEGYLISGADTIGCGFVHSVYCVEQ